MEDLKELVEIAADAGMGLEISLALTPSHNVILCDSSEELGDEEGLYEDLAELNVLDQAEDEVAEDDHE